MRWNRILYFLLISVFLIHSCGKMEPIVPSGFEINIAADSIVFAVIGDFGKDGEAEEAVANMVKSWNPDFILTTGDNNYEKGLMSTIDSNISKYYGDYIYNFDAPEEYRCNGKAFEEEINRFFPCPGNHDANNIDGIQPYLNFFTLPQEEENYSFSWGPVQFFSLNSLRLQMMPQYEWMAEQIELSELPFTIAYFHHPPYSSGNHGNNTRTQLDYHSLGIDLVLSGHDHIYSRISKKDEPGLYYIISGASGKSLYDGDSNPLPAEDFDVFTYDEDFGALRITASFERMTIEYYSISNGGIKTDSINKYPHRQ